jgi:hypothetical protein
MVKTWNNVDDSNESTGTDSQSLLLRWGTVTDNGDGTARVTMTLKDEAGVTPTLSGLNTPVAQFRVMDNALTMEQSQTGTLEQGTSWVVGEGVNSAQCTCRLISISGTLDIKVSANGNNPATYYLTMQEYMGSTFRIRPTEIYVQVDIA